ncbi:MAG TPA: hypothetical protein VF173_30465 [Thermoanaerobaculia bacterium]|nr:hypothetical protein [Thermoanaerobaculia bacterium]
MLVVLAALVFAPVAAAQEPRSPSPASPATVGELLGALRDKAKALEGTAGMRLAFQSLNSRFKLPQDAVRYSDFVIVRLIFEATRDAGFWNLHWAITNREPESDNIWRQWQVVRQPLYAKPTATAECDELSALFAFLSRSLGVKGIGLLWPYSNHTVAAWEIHPAGRKAVRVVVPTTQIFLSPTDFFGTTTFDPWRQRTIPEYTRRDAQPTLQFPRALLNFFLEQAQRYGGATDSTLQRLRYQREAVFRGNLTPDRAAVNADLTSLSLTGAPPEDLAAFTDFAREMRTAEAGTRGRNWR